VIRSNHYYQRIIVADVDCNFAGWASMPLTAAEQTLESMRFYGRDTVQLQSHFQPVAVRFCPGCSKNGAADGMAHAKTAGF
jgi:hypothetical protein